MQAPWKQTCVKMQGRVSHKQLITSELILRLLEEVASFVCWHPQFPLGKVLMPLLWEIPWGLDSKSCNDLPASSGIRAGQGNTSTESLQTYVSSQFILWQILLERHHW